MSRPEILYAVSLDGTITKHPVKPEHNLIQINDRLWVYTQGDGSTHELWTTETVAIASARRDLKRLTNFLNGLHKKLSVKIKEGDE